MTKLYIHLVDVQTYYLFTFANISQIPFMFTNTGMQRPRISSLWAYTFNDINIRRGHCHIAINSNPVLGTGVAKPNMWRWHLRHQIRFMRHSPETALVRDIFSQSLIAHPGLAIGVLWFVSMYTLYQGLRKKKQGYLLRSVHISHFEVQCLPTWQELRQSCGLSWQECSPGMLSVRPRSWMSDHPRWPPRIPRTRCGLRNHCRYYWHRWSQSWGLRSKYPVCGYLGMRRQVACLFCQLRGSRRHRHSWMTW